MQSWPTLTQSLPSSRFPSRIAPSAATDGSLGAGTAHKIDIAESAINLKAIYSVIVPQSKLKSSRSTLQ